ncbi:hypothetical protein ACLOJK_017783 [Asimina triloba]
MAEEKTQSKLKDGHSKKRKWHASSKATALVSKEKMMTKSKGDRGRRRTQKGPLLPSSLRKELGLVNPKHNDDVPREEGANDLYEYDEPVPQEESKKNRRFDPVDNLEYELPEGFEDEDVPSDDDDVADGDEGKDEVDSEVEDDKDRHSRMLQGITGMPVEAFEGKRRKKEVLSEAYPESEYNLTRNPQDGDGRISVQDLLDPLHGKPGFSKLRKRMHQLEKKSMSVPAPLPKPQREKLERKVAYKQSSKDITRWEPLVKRNREAPTVYFGENVDLRYSTVGAIASEFEPRTEFEKKMASLVCNAKVMEAHEQDGARLLELNKISVEEVKDRQNRLAKMRSLLFLHEMKAKHIKKIKSKTYHRILKKDRSKTASAGMEMDHEAAKEFAMKQEFKRAEVIIIERMTLKHENSSKWAKRILKRGLKAQDEGTQAAISEQLHQHALLTRKMNSMKDNSSSDDSSDEDEDEGSTDSEGPSKLLTRAKEKTLKVMEEEDEMPKTGVLSLPFMVRGLEKRKESANEEAQLALQEYDSSLRHFEDENGKETPKGGTSSGRRVFGVDKKQSQDARYKVMSDGPSKNSDDSQDEFEARENNERHEEIVASQEEVQVNPGLFLDEADMSHETLFKIKKEDDDGKDRKSPAVVEFISSKQDPKVLDQSSDSESDEEMVDGILSNGPMPEYELPSQADLIQSAFASDDVEGDFEKDKMEVLDDENPEPEKPVLLPGWGQWTHIQQKKGLPAWMTEEHEAARKKREDALKKRKDADLKRVIISEKIDKKAEKLRTKTLPFPFTSKEVFEQSIRMPIGPEFNPVSSAGALNRPAWYYAASFYPMLADYLMIINLKVFQCLAEQLEQSLARPDELYDSASLGARCFEHLMSFENRVVKKPGVIIKPIQFEEVNPQEKTDQPKKNGQAVKSKKSNAPGLKSARKTQKTQKAKRS